MNLLKSQVTTNKILFPVLLLAFATLVAGGFQLTGLIRERATLDKVFAQQTPLIEQSQKLETQFSALALSTKKLADGGDKDAAALVEGLKKSGVNFGDEPTTPGPAGTAMSGQPITPPIPPQHPQAHEDSAPKP